MRPHRHVMPLLVALLIASLAPSPARATTVLFVGVGEMTTLSDWIVQVRVTDVAFIDLRAEGKGLFTDITMDVIDVFKGQDVPKRYVMRLVGGRGADGMALMVPGMPVFSVGQRAVLFLEKTNIGHVPCGLGQGVWRIHDSNASRPWVEQSIHDLHMMRRNEHGNLEEVELEPASWGLPMIRLIEEIYATLDRPPTPEQTPIESTPLAP
ncbi:MAG: hypothetical protein EP329_25360 [Deltaproteobacteria bacterium]|nr:MAG: hypothetical protein EP329_25360 [Deltaproteobacteria bacterium]